MDNKVHTLSLQGFGTRLRAKDGLLVATVPDLSGSNNQREESFAPQTINMILIHPKSSISGDAMLLALQHKVPIIVVDHREKSIVFMAGSEPANSILIWKQQLLLHQTPEGLNYARRWLGTKTLRQIEWLNKLRSYRKENDLDAIDTCIADLKTTFSKISTTQLHSFSLAAAQIRGIEGAAQRKYLNTLSTLLPPQSQFTGRSRQPSENLFNALLNYGYGILYNIVENALWEAGLMPYIGFMHGSEERGHKTLLFDFIEPYRPWIDQVAFNLCVRKLVNIQTHATPTTDGAVYLSDLGRKVMAEATLANLNTRKVEIDDRWWFRSAAIRENARRFAAELARKPRTGLAAPDSAPQPATS